MVVKEVIESKSRVKWQRLTATEMREVWFDVKYLSKIGFHSMKLFQNNGFSFKS